MVVLGVGSVGSCSYNGVNDSQGGIFSPLDWVVLDPIGLSCLVRHLSRPVRACDSGGLWDHAGHTGGGLLQLPPMPEKPIISQVGPLGAWITWRDGPDGRILG